MSSAEALRAMPLKSFIYKVFSDFLYKKLDKIDWLFHIFLKDF